MSSASSSSSAHRTRASAAALKPILDKYPAGAQPLVKVALQSRATLIAMYAEKGGVGKTTQSGSLAWGLAQKGHRVLVYDCDAQRSLSNWLLGHRIREAPYHQDYDAFINRQLPNPADHERPRTLFQQLEPVRNQQRQVQAAYPEPIPECPNLWLVPGDRLIVEYDAHIAAAEALINIVPGQANLLGAPYHAMLATAAAVDAEFIIVDLNPSRGVLNRCIATSAHFLIAPVIPDFFSYEMLRDLGNALTGWQQRMDQLKAQLALHNQNQQAAILHPLPRHVCQFMGYILSRYKIMPGTPLGQVQPNGLTDDKMSTNESFWAGRVEATVQQARQQLLANHPPMCIPDVVYTAVQRQPCIGRVSDYNQLAALSGTFHRPVAFLDRQQMTTPAGPMVNGAAVYADNVLRFRRITMATVDTILELMAHSPHPAPFQ